MDRKQEQRERHLRALKHVRSREERKQLELESRQRKSEQVPRGRRRQVGAEDDADFEPIRRVRKRVGRTPQPEAVVGAGPSTGGEPEFDGLVVGLSPGRCRIERAAEHLEAELAEELARTQRTSLAVGDRVALRELEPGRWRAIAVQPRTSTLSRPDPGRPDLERVLAANVDVGVIVAAVAQPALRQRLIDRYLIALQRGGIDAVVCANKADLVADSSGREAIEALLEPYAALSCPVLWTSATTGEGIDELRRLLAGRLAVLVGQSGVGKSSLLAALAPGLARDPEIDLEVGRVRAGDGKGRHTTTASSLLRWRSLGLIDTPGVRSFGLQGVGRADLHGYFPEFRQHVEACRFRDCLHVSEPHCAVRRAAAEGALPEARYATYLRILETLE